MYRDNTSFHWSIQNTPFFLTFGIEPRQPGVPMPEICQKLYGESNDEELTKRLLLARKTAREMNKAATT
jgi:hypothetical protein